MTLQIGPHCIGDGHPAFIVAEMAWGHDGKVELGKRIISAAAEGGAAMINIHLTDVPNYMVPHYGAGAGRVSAGKDAGGESVYDYHRRLNLNFDQFEELYRHARSCGLLVSGMVNDPPSLEFASTRIDPDMLMVHPSSVTEEGFLRAVAARGKPLLIYVGGLRLSEIENAIEQARAEGNEKLILQYGFQSYPTQIQDNNISYIKGLKAMFGLPVSFTDHTDGDDPMALVVPLLGLALGANMIEKHLTFDRAARPEDFEAALNPDEFRLLVERIRLSESAIGTSGWKPLSPAQLRYRGVVRKRAVAARAIRAGEIIDAAAICYKRSDQGLYPEEIGHLLGRKARVDIAANAGIDWDVI